MGVGCVMDTSSGLNYSQACRWTHATEYIMTPQPQHVLHAFDVPRMRMWHEGILRSGAEADAESEHWSGRSASSRSLSAAAPGETCSIKPIGVPTSEICGYRLNFQRSNSGRLRRCTSILLPHVNGMYVHRAPRMWRRWRNVA